MDGGAWWAAVHGVAKSQTRLSDFTFTFYFHSLEKDMATHSSCLENPRDGGAWWAALCGVAQSRTRLKQLGSSSSSVCVNMCVYQGVVPVHFSASRVRVPVTLYPCQHLLVSVVSISAIPLGVQ